MPVQVFPVSARNRARDWRPRPTKRTFATALGIRGVRNMSVARKLIQFAMLPVELQYLYMHSISIPDRQIVFAKNSKAGCTSVAHALQAALSNYPCSGRIHEENDVLIQGYDNWSIARAAFESETVFKFTTIRNPLRRIVSAYLDIFVERRNPASIHHRAAIEFVERDGGDALTKRFSRFVDFVQEDSWPGNGSPLATTSPKYRP